ncbi:hypothetical protein U91I_00279 [alpha proteobacterium U9-1i]|nr:hypothetical protein U91I_00279 [alpha proteobacterium U9-1i]
MTVPLTGPDAATGERMLQGRPSTRASLRGGETDAKHKPL